MSRQDLDAARDAADAARCQGEGNAEGIRTAADRAAPGRRGAGRGAAAADAGPARAAAAAAGGRRTARSRSIAVVRSRLVEPGEMASPQKAAFTLAMTEPEMGPRLCRRDRPGRSCTPASGRYGDGRRASRGARSPAGSASFHSVAEFTPKSVRDPRAALEPGLRGARVRQRSARRIAPGHAGDGAFAADRRRRRDRCR